MAEQLHLWPAQAPVPRLRWSISRARCLDHCSRQYYLRYYASVGGKRAAEGSLAREAYVLKQLSNRFMWVGNVVHSLVEQALTAWRGGGQIDVDVLVARGARRMRAEFFASSQKHILTQPTETFGLVEHIYDEPIAAAEWRAVRARMERCVRHFAQLPLAARIKQLLPLDWLALESRSQFEMHKAAIVVVPDVAWREAGGQIVLVDWKTGQPNSASDSLQLGVYALFAERVWAAPAAQITAHDVYLDTAHTASFVVTPQVLERAVAYIEQSTAQMHTLAARPGGAPLEASRFPMTSDHRRCVQCAFRKLCRRP